MRILIVEDEPGISNFLKQGLEEESFSVDIVENGNKGLQLALSGDYDLLLLDWMVPGADRSIVPIRNIIETTNRITKNNLNERVDLPAHTDELFHLSASINELLQRLENAIEKERQFTSDASHELRTPLASLRGILEVLIRKPREQVEYEEKIKYSLSEIDRMTTIIEQLLPLARLDSNAKSNNLVSKNTIYQSLRPLWKKNH